MPEEGSFFYFFLSAKSGANVNHEIQGKNIIGITSPGNNSGY
jgi:hypothetical protein